jgi:hypothetical protein
LTVAAPQRPEICPPGHYMLFVPQQGWGPVSRTDRAGRLIYGASSSSCCSLADPRRGETAYRPRREYAHPRTGRGRADRIDWHSRHGRPDREVPLRARGVLGRSVRGVEEAGRGCGGAANRECRALDSRGLSL